jgi:hypothetical protein
MKENGTLTWNLKALSKALKISLADTQEYFTDGRRISFMLKKLGASTKISKLKALKYIKNI